MERVRAIRGLGWVDATSRRFVLPRASVSSLVAPESALPFELAERDAGPIAIVRGASLDAAQRADVRACLADVVSDVAFLLAGEKSAYIVDPDADVVACLEALVALRGESIVDPWVVVRGVGRAAYLDATTERPIELTRHRAPLDRAYADATVAAVIRADLDRLMVYNDWLGFLEGDLLVARVIGLACEVARGPRATRDVQVSLVRREVVVLAADVDPVQTHALAEALVEGMRRLRVQLRHPEVRAVPYMTLSAGAAWIADTSRTPIERALEEADAALQRAKLEGRDRVAVSCTEP